MLRSVFLPKPWILFFFFVYGTPSLWYRPGGARPLVSVERTTTMSSVCPLLLTKRNYNLGMRWGNGTAEGRGKKKGCGQRDLIESRSGRLVTPSNQTWCHSHLISNLWRGCSRLGRGEKKNKDRSLFAARDLVGVFTRDRCVCLFVTANPEAERGRVTKTGEVTMTEACLSAPGSREVQAAEGGYSCDLLESNKTKDRLPRGSE